MKNVILAVVAIAALTLAGMGGVFANWQDIETSEDNYFGTGALDLKVSDTEGIEYDDPNVPVFLELLDAWPECISKDMRFDLHNAGQGTQDVPWLYLHFKNYECGWVVPKAVFHWINCNNITGECEVVPAPPKPGGGDWTHNDRGTGLPKPVNEPEYVAECGGIAGELVDGTLQEVPGIGCCYGDNCQLSRHIDVAIFTSTTGFGGPWVAVNLSKYNDDPVDGFIKLNEIECEEIELGQLPNCNTVYVMISLRLQDIPEEYFGMDFFDEIYPEAKWNDWPTNALQKDVLNFDISFELLQNRVP